MGIINTYKGAYSSGIILFIIDKFLLTGWRLWQKWINDQGGICAHGVFFPHYECVDSSRKVEVEIVTKELLLEYPKEIGFEYILTIVNGICNSVNKPHFVFTSSDPVISQLSISFIYF